MKQAIKLFCYKCLIILSLLAALLLADAFLLGLLPLWGALSLALPCLLGVYLLVTNLPPQKKQRASGTVARRATKPVAAQSKAA